MLKTVTILTIFVPAILAAVLPDIGLDGKIIGGNETTIEKFPYQVSMQSYSVHVCGGSVLNPTTILTAAHCTDGKTPDHLTVRAGSTNNDKGGQRIKVVKIIQHEKYSQISKNNDVSLLKLEKPLAFGPAVQPVVLQEQGVDVAPGNVATVTGWGRTIPDNPKSGPENLRMTHVTTIDPADCKKKLSKFPFTDNMICCSSDGHDSCQGDSGGPLVYNGKQFGIVSWGYKCGDGRYPGVYTRVATVRDWIDANVKASSREEIIPKLDGKIIGGQETKIETIPYQIGLNYIDSHICGGTIIHPNYVITAAHCTDEKLAKFLYIRAGSSDKDDGGQEVKVAEIIQHEKFDIKTFDNDIAILKLSQPLKFDKTKQPAKLQSTKVATGTKAIVSGWGVTKQGTHDKPEKVRKVEIVVKSDEECTEAYKNEFTKAMLCAGAPGKDACQGDSGGPLVANGNLIGVVSWGEGCASPTHPGIYANVSYFRDWIKKKINV